MLVRAPCILPFVLTVCCWLRNNAAIPLASDLSVANQMRNVFEEEKIHSQDNWRNAASRLRTKRNAEPQSSSSDDSFNDGVSTSSEDEESSKNKVKIDNQNVNVNILRQHSGRNKSRKIPAPVPTTTTYNPKVIKIQEDRSCVSGRKKNQRYSSSFIGNTTNRGVAVDKEFDDVIGNNSKAKTTSSVHVGEDITLCWIETTTIKEDKNVRPPKRLVIREYTISFENSATIPDRYLECERFEGELAANDPEIGKTALFEVIDEDTKTSKVVNFTTVSNVGDVLVWQHKRVKCGVGPVVNKNIIEWHDGSENPKKRVEIKVSPEMHQLTAKKDEQEPCTEEIDESSAEYNRTSDSTESCENTAESGACEVTTQSDEGPSMHPESDGTEEEVVTELLPSDEVGNDEIGSDETGSSESGSEETLNLPTGYKTSTLSYEATVSRLISTTKTPISEKSDESVLPGEDCDEDSSDPKCATRASDMFSPEELSVESSTVEDKSLEKLLTESSFGSSERDVATIPDSATEQTTPIVSRTNVSIESGDFSDFVDISGPPDQTRESGVSTPAEGSSSEEVDKESSVTSMEINVGTMTSGEAGSEKIVTTTLPTLGLTKFTKEVLKHGRLPDKSSESSESLSISEPSSMSEDVSFEEIEETVTIKTIDRATTMEPEVISKTELIPVVSTTTSLPKYPPIVLSPAPSNEADYTCENSEDCARATSTVACDETGDCHTTSRSCESGECPDEEVDYSGSETISPVNALATEAASTTMIALTSEEAENGSTAINSIPTTVEARRSTPLSSMTTAKPRHKFTLKVKILLEHVNDKKEKENLVEVEKRLLLNENPERRRQVTDELLEQLKSLNDSVNVETMNALLNCTSLSRLTKNANFIKVEPNDVVDESLEDSGRPEDSRQLSSAHVDAKYEDSQYRESDEEIEAVSRRRRRRSLDANLTMVDTNDTLADASGLYIAEENRLDLNDSSTSDSNSSLSFTSGYEQQYDTSLPTEENVQLSTTMHDPEAETTDVVYVEVERNTTRGKNESEVITKTKSVSNETKMEVIRETLPGIKEDVSIGLQRVVSELTHGNLTLVKDGRELAKVSLMGILANPKDDRIHSRRRREAMEEVGRWSNERIRKTPILGGNLRSFTEFTLYKVLP